MEREQVRNRTANGPLQRIKFLDSGRQTLIETNERKKSASLEKRQKAKIQKVGSVSPNKAKARSDKNSHSSPDARQET